MDHFKQEALRLVSELIDAAHGTVLNEDQSREDETRAALLAHIQRGAVPEGWHLDESEAALLHHLTSPDDEGVHSPITLRVGNVRMDDGVVKFGLLCEYTDYPEEGATLLVECQTTSPDQFRNAAKMMAVQPSCMTCNGHGMVGGLLPNGGGYESYPCTDCTTPAPAEVPMPDVFMYGVKEPDGGAWMQEVCVSTLKGDVDELVDDLNEGREDADTRYTSVSLVTMEDAERYGAACRASGEAAGYAKRLAESGSDAKRYRFITDDHADSDVRRAVSAVCDAIVIRGKGATDAAIDALREKAKPAKCDGNHGGPRCADPECWQDPAGAVIYVRTEAERLVKNALAVGVVLTIETQPRQPLAMRNYDLVVQTREVRNG